MLTVTPTAAADGADTIPPLQRLARPDPKIFFAPNLQVSADTSAAGGHPDLAIRFFKPPNRCAKPIQSLPPNMCTLANTVEQQDFKKVAITLPRGLVADVDAAPTCAVKENAIWAFGLPRYYCDPAVPAVGTISGFISNCTDQGGVVVTCGPDPGTSQAISGPVFMGSPARGEQARLVAFVGVVLGPGLVVPEIVRVDIAATVDTSGVITATADNIPDVGAMVDGLGNPAGNIPAQVDDMILTLFGSTGSGAGAPFVTNPTSCSPRSFSAQAQGYAQNPYYDPNIGFFPYASGFGDGTTVTGLTAPYPVTDCGALPYSPTFSIDIEPTAPGAAPAITSTITQAAGEQTTGKVAVKFPRKFRVNFKNKLGQCTDAEFNGRNCPADSVMGTATADSNLLPAGSGPLTGGVYLGQTDLASGKIKVLVDIANGFLPGGIRLTGETHINADGSLEAAFDQVPELPIKSFTLSLAGGTERGLLINPKNCGPQQLEVTMTSHEGTQILHQPQVRIPCQGAASLKVTMSTKRANKHPTIKMDVSALGMQRLKLRLPSGLKVARRLTPRRSYGGLDFITDEGTTAAKLKTRRRTSRGGRTTFSGTTLGTQVAGLTFKHKRSNQITISRIPQGTISASLELRGRTDKFLTNPSRCRSAKRGKKSRAKRKRLKFSATVTNLEGKTFAPSFEARVRCGKRKKGKRGM